MATALVEAKRLRSTTRSGSTRPPGSAEANRPRAAQVRAAAALVAPTHACRRRPTRVRQPGALPQLQAPTPAAHAPTAEITAMALIAHGRQRPRGGCRRNCSDKLATAPAQATCSAWAWAQVGALCAALKLGARMRLGALRAAAWSGGREREPTAVPPNWSDEVLAWNGPCRAAAAAPAASAGAIGSARHRPHEPETEQRDPAWRYWRRPRACAKPRHRPPPVTAHVDPGTRRIAANSPASCTSTASWPAKTSASRCALPAIARSR